MIRMAYMYSCVFSMSTNDMLTTKLRFTQSYLDDSRRSAIFGIIVSVSTTSTLKDGSVTMMV